MKTEKEMPQKIDSYSLIKTFKNPRKGSIILGIYKNSNGEEAIAKKWQGRIKNLEHYFLNNEINAYHLIHSLYEKYGTEILDKFPRINIPKLIKAIAEKNSLLLLVEKVEGEILSNFSAKEKIKVMSEIINYFKFLGSLIDSDKKPLIIKRRGWFYVARFPSLLIQAAIKHPTILPELAQATFRFLLLIPNILGEKELSLVHRDFNYENIIINHSIINVIDMEYMALTSSVLNIAQIILESSKDKNTQEVFYKSSIMKEIFSNKISLQVFKAFFLYSAIFNIATEDEGEFNDNFLSIKEAIAISEKTYEK